MTAAAAVEYNITAHLQGATIRTIARQFVSVE